jgi:exosortase/archaeosortase family protein
MSQDKKARGRRPVLSTHRPVLVFLAKCIAFWGVALWGVSRFPAIENAGIRATVVTLEWAFRLIGQKAVVYGTSISALGTSVEIVSDCSPHMPFLIFAAVVLAFPSTWKQRLLGLLFGAVVIHVFNTIRIMSLVGVLAWRASWFDFAHVYLWQTGTIVIVFVTFALWIKTLSPRAPAAPAPRPAP